MSEPRRQGSAAAGRVWLLADHPRNPELVFDFPFNEELNEAVKRLPRCWFDWRRKIVERYLTRPEATAEPTCRPGPFSMASADTTTDVFVRAGFEDISLQRCDIEIAIGADFDPAVELVIALGRAGELIRLAGSDAEAFRSSVVAARVPRCRAPGRGATRPAV
jgi:hypothetical protein